MESLYLFEILLENFEFTDSKTAPENENIKTNVVCGKLINFMIEPSKNESSKETTDSPFNLGKSILFPSTTENLLSLMEKESLHISIIDNKIVATLGLVTVQWPKEFINAIKEHNESNKMKPVLEHNQYEIVDTRKVVVGKVRIFMRLNTFGHNIEIDFQRMGSTINVDKIKSRLKDTQRKLPAESTDELTSWQPLFRSPFKEKRSYMDPGLKLYAEMQGLQVPPSLNEVLTTDYINRQLCGNTNCPGAQKFKEYGIGPLSPKGGGLGTLGTSMKTTKTHGSYGLSQAYGNLDKYGAYGLFVNNRNKQTCGSPDCPYTNVPQYQTNVNNMCSNQRKQSFSTNYGGTAFPYNVPQNSKNKTNDNNCGGTTCPYSAVQNVTNNNTNYNNIRSTTSPYTMPKHVRNETNDNNCGGTTCPYNAPQNFTNNTNYNNIRATTSPYTMPKNVRNETNYNCGGQTCPYSVIQAQYNFQQANKNYGGISKYSEPQQYKNKISLGQINTVPCEGTTCPFSTKENTSATNNCGGQTCPLSTSQIKHSFGQVNTVPCGGTTCPFSTKQNNSATNNCGGQTCPLSTSQMEHNNDRKVSTNCGGTTCPFTETYEHINKINSNFCADQNCPFTKFQSRESFNYGSTTCTYTITKNQIITNEMISNNYDGKPNVYTDNEAISGFNELTMDTNVVVTEKSYTETFQKKTETEKKPETGRQGSTKTGDGKKYYSRFVYRGERYPGTRIGHKTCYTMGKNVPSHMGWLWTVEQEGVVKRRKSWRPGFVSKTINDRIIARRQELGIPEPPALTMLVAKKKIKYIRPQASDDNFYEEPEPKPTLMINKKDGRYVITVNPLKDPKTLAENENPYMECSPMQFVLVKNKPQRKPAITDTSDVEEEGEEEAEEDVYELGYEASDERTIYENEYTECYCDDDLKVLNNCSSTSSSESEFNLEFTTPAGMIVPGGMKKLPNVVHTPTQFHAEDWNCTDCPTIIPKKFKHKKKVRLRLR